MMVMSSLRRNPAKEFHNSLSDSRGNTRKDFFLTIPNTGEEQWNEIYLTTVKFA